MNAPGPDGRTVPLWARWLGKPRPGGKDIDMFSTNDPEWGILGTPVISDDRKTLYFNSPLTKSLPHFVA